MSQVNFSNFRPTVRTLLLADPVVTQLSIPVLADDVSRQHERDSKEALHNAAPYSVVEITPIMAGQRPSGGRGYMEMQCHLSVVLRVNTLKYSDNTTPAEILYSLLSTLANGQETLGVNGYRFDDDAFLLLSDDPGSLTHQINLWIPVQVFPRIS